MKYFFSLLIALSILGASCKKENTAPDSTIEGQNYFPAISGFTRFYHIDSISWNNFTGKIDTTSYEVKEVIGNYFTDNSGRPTYELLRYRLDETSGNWVIWKVWSMNALTTRAEQVEDNVRYVKLHFPPTLNSRWNGNVYNTLGELQYKITDQEQLVYQDTLTLSDVLTVIQEDEDNLSERHYAEERYAANIGLSYKKLINQTKVFPTEDIESGYIYTEILVGHSPIYLIDAHQTPSF